MIKVGWTLECRSSLSDRNRATILRQPVQKYVCSSFMVKMNFKFGSLGSFELVWVKDNVQVRNLSSLNFKACEGKKFKFFGVIKFWTSLHKVGNILESTNM